MKKTLLLVVIVAGLIAFFQFKGQPADTSLSNDSEQSAELTEPQEPTNLDEETLDGPRSLQILSSQEFKELYDSLRLPNTRLLIEPPPITGNPQADTVIREIAESRGYSLQLVPSGQLSSIGGLTMQQLMHEDWLSLKKAAKNEGIDLMIRSAYRSVEDQRSLFLLRLRQAGITNQDIVAGLANVSIDDILRFAAPPGYSRHHSGYTIDIADTAAAVFEFSGGFSWLSGNNYENAKRHGFIPSYPEGLNNQGPEPEPWEYVWVNRDFVVE